MRSAMAAVHVERLYPEAMSVEGRVDNSLVVVFLNTSTSAGWTSAESPATDTRQPRPVGSNQPMSYLRAEFQVLVERSKIEPP